MGKLFAKWLLVAMFVAYCAFANAEIVKLNNVVRNIDSSLSLQQGDPFIVATLDASAISGKTERILRLNAKLELAETNLKFELYFRPVEPKANTFSPNHRILFEKTLSTGDEPLLFSIPDSVKLHHGQLIRIDIDQCAPCSLSIEEPILELQSGVSTITESAIEPSAVYNGASNVEPNGFDISTDNWGQNDMQAFANGFTISGNDPYLTSPEFLLDTQSLAGIYFELKAPRPYVDYQVFYATEAQGFTQAASSIVGVKTNPNGLSRFYIPLRYLSTQSPVASTLRRVRLDVIEPEGEAELNSSSQWSLKRVYVVAKSQSSDYAQFTPARITQHKTQRSDIKQLIKGIISKITADLGFTISYSLLLLITIIGLIRMITQVSK